MKIFQKQSQKQTNKKFQSQFELLSSNKTQLSKANKIKYNAIILQQNIIKISFFKLKPYLNLLYNKIKSSFISQQQTDKHMSYPNLNNNMNSMPIRSNFPQQYQTSYNKYLTSQSYNNSYNLNNQNLNLGNMGTLGNLGNMSNIPNMSSVTNMSNISNLSNIYPNSSQTSIALFHIPSDATNSLYIDGVPNDASQREVSHIFRPFPGFQCIRLIKKTTNTGRDYFLCFVDFENVLQSTVAFCTLQGYRFDKHDRVGLKISYAKQSKEVTKQKSVKKYK